MYNEEKEPVYFVWEKRHDRTVRATFRCAKYRGSVVERNKHIATKHLLTKEEELLDVKELAIRYPFRGSS